MTLHPRVSVNQSAQIELDQAICAIVKKYDLTSIELAVAINTVQASWLKYGLRAERHPCDPDKGADEA